MDDLLPGEELVEVSCYGCGAIMEIPEGHVRTAYGGRITTNRCHDCARGHRQLVDGRKQEFKTRFNDIIKTQNRAQAKRRLEAFPVVDELAKLKPGRGCDPGYERLLDTMIGVMRGQHDYKPFSTPAITPGFKAELLERDPYLDGPVPRDDIQKTCGQQRKEMKEMRRRGEIPMASMFPQINVYHRPEEHARMGLDGNRCPECCADPKNAGLSQKTIRRLKKEERAAAKLAELALPPQLPAPRIKTWNPDRSERRSRRTVI